MRIEYLEVEAAQNLNTEKYLSKGKGVQRTV